jgi:uncharacterized protein
MKKKQLAASAFAGLVFALGLGVSGMTLPSKVMGFLDVTGAWDPSLAVVMVGAIGVHAAALFAMRKQRAPWFADAFEPSSATKPIDSKLLVGAALFGVGWGAGGYCPGPALVACATGGTSPLVFVGAMTLGILAEFFAFRRSRPTSV